MADPLPRRLRRFAKGGTEQGVMPEPVQAETAAPAGEPSVALHGNREKIISAIIAQAKEKMQDRTNALASKEIENFKERHNRYPQTDGEYDEIADSIFGQLKDEMEKKEIRKRGKVQQSFLEERMNRRKAGASAEEKAEAKPASKRRRMQEEGAEEEGRIPADSEGAEVETGEGAAEGEEAGVFGEEGEDAGQGGGADELGTQGFSEEESDSLEEELKSLSLDDDSDLVTKEFDAARKKCPNCRNPASDIIYCPNCGTGFCAHCAKGAEVLQEQIKYTCPKCGFQFKGRRLE
ncbi:MAG: zinc ribbon domain-containing protein [Candidatus Diapherotrites archaeon]